jgi:L-ascorbate metabolism protein UlaG (beta-lactamase superfamily)
MQLTKFTHSCVLISDDSDRRLVIDPGVFSEAAEALQGIDAVLLTHQHPDHVDAAALVTAAAANADLRIWGPRDIIDSLAGEAALDGRLTAVGPGETFTAGGLPVRTFGGQHALIHSSIPVVANVGYLVGDAVYHPGDSFVVPTASVELVLVPTHAPWSKTAEVIDFTVAVRAPHAVGIHDSLLTDIGRTMVEGHVGRISGEHGTHYRHLGPRESIEL